MRVIIHSGASLQKGGVGDDDDNKEWAEWVWERKDFMHFGINWTLKSVQSAV